MLQDKRDRQTIKLWRDKLAPKVVEIQEALRQLAPKDIARRSGTKLQDGRLCVQMLFQPYMVDAQTFEVYKANGEAVPSFFQSLVLTYLQTADGAGLAERWISFRELPDGAFYHRAFQGYAPNRLTKRWPMDVDGFATACRALGGMRLNLGDAGFVLRVLPRVDMAAVYWLGDQDFPSRASILFDANAHHYMVTDGLAILGNMLVSKILSAN
jgi:hypothetical protein